MSLEGTIKVIMKLAEAGAIEEYAIAGAVAALNYIEPMLTEDLDVLVSIAGFEQRKSGLILLTPIEKELNRIGYNQRTDVGYLIEGWPVQFLPVASPLDEEALKQANDIEMPAGDGTSFKVRCLSAEHVVAKAISVGRLKDLARVQAFLEQDKVDLQKLRKLLERHKLMAAWLDFCKKADIENPL